MFGEDAAAVAWTCLYLPQRGRVAAGLPRMPSSQHQANPARRKGGVTGNQNLGFREVGGRKEEVGGRVVGLESWNSLRRGKRLGTGIPGFCREVGTRWLIKVQEVEVPVSGPQQSLALTPVIWCKEKSCFCTCQDVPAQGQINAGGANLLLISGYGGLVAQVYSPWGRIKVP